MAASEAGTKFCPKCRETLDVSEFSKNSAHHSGYQAYCKPCTSEYQKRRYLENPAALERKRRKNRENSKLYYMKKRDEILAKRKERREKKRNADE